MSWSKVVVTGAASGIGRAFARTLARRGAHVGLIDVSAGGLHDAAEEIRRDGHRADVSTADVSAGEVLKSAVEDLVVALGGLDLVIHCAAILGPGPFLHQSAAEFDRVVRIDLLGTANLLRAVFPALHHSRGSVACLASTAAVHGWPVLGAYSAAKFGVAGLCDAIRPELAREGVSLTSVFPLLIDTPLLAGAEAAPILKQGKRLPPDTVVEKTLAGVIARKPRVFIPGSVRILAALHGLAPSLLDWYGRRYGLV